MPIIRRTPLTNNTSIGRKKRGWRKNTTSSGGESNASSPIIDSQPPITVSKQTTNLPYPLHSALNKKAVTQCPIDILSRNSKYTSKENATSECSQSDASSTEDILRLIEDYASSTESDGEIRAAPSTESSFKSRLSPKFDTRSVCEAVTVQNDSPKPSTSYKCSQYSNRSDSVSGICRSTPSSHDVLKETKFYGIQNSQIRLSNMKRLPRARNAMEIENLSPAKNTITEEDNSEKISSVSVSLSPTVRLCHMSYINDVNENIIKTSLNSNNANVDSGQNQNITAVTNLKSAKCFPSHVSKSESVSVLSTEGEKCNLENLIKDDISIEGCSKIPSPTEEKNKSPESEFSPVDNESLTSDCKPRRASQTDGYLVNSVRNTEQTPSQRTESPVKNVGHRVFSFLSPCSSSSTTSLGLSSPDHIYKSIPIKPLTVRVENLSDDEIIQKCYMNDPPLSPPPLGGNDFRVKLEPLSVRFSRNKLPKQNHTVQSQFVDKNGIKLVSAKGVKSEKSLKPCATNTRFVPEQGSISIQHLTVYNDFQSIAVDDLHSKVEKEDSTLDLNSQLLTGKSNAIDLPKTNENVGLNSGIKVEKSRRGRPPKSITSLLKNTKTLFNSIDETKHYNKRGAMHKDSVKSSDKQLSVLQEKCNSDLINVLKTDENDGLNRGIKAGKKRRGRPPKNKSALLKNTKTLCNIVDKTELQDKLNIMHDESVKSSLAVDVLAAEKPLSILPEKNFSELKIDTGGIHQISECETEIFCKGNEVPKNPERTKAVSINRKTKEIHHKTRDGLKEKELITNTTIGMANVKKTKKSICATLPDATTQEVQLMDHKLSETLQEDPCNTQNTKTSSYKIKRKDGLKVKITLMNNSDSVQSDTSPYNNSRSTTLTSIVPNLDDIDDMRSDNLNSSQSDTVVISSESDSMSGIDQPPATYDNLSTLIQTESIDMEKEYKGDKTLLNKKVRGKLNLETRVTKNMEMILSSSEVMDFSETESVQSNVDPGLFIPDEYSLDEYRIDFDAMSNDSKVPTEPVNDAHIPLMETHKETICNMSNFLSNKQLHMSACVGLGEQIKVPPSGVIICKENVKPVAVGKEEENFDDNLVSLMSGAVQFNEDVKTVAVIKKTATIINAKSKNDHDAKLRPDHEINNRKRRKSKGKKKKVPTATLS